MYSSSVFDAYCFALDELVIYPYCENNVQRFEVRKQAIEILLSIPQPNRPSVCRLAIGCLILGNIEKAFQLIELGLSKSEKI